MHGVLAIVLAFAARARAEDAAAWLEKLRAPSALERAEAERWLARHLETADLDRVKNAARTGDAEVRRRLELAIGDSDARLALAVALACDADAAAAEVGRGAIAERLDRWCPAWERRGRDRAATLRSLSGKSDRTVSIDTRTSDRRLDVALDQLARFGPGLPPLVLDPDLALSDHPREPGDSLEGPSDRVLGDLVRLHRAELESYALPAGESAEPGDEPDPAGPLQPWIRVRRAAETEARSGVERIVGWCLEVVRARDPARRSACAQAIASTGWPGGIAWLGERAAGGKDEAALDGILLAAGRGRVAPGLARPDLVRDLLVRMREASGETGRDPVRADPVRAERIARALASAGPFGARDEDLAALAAQDLGTLAPKEQWLRLVVLEGLRSPSRPAASAVDALLASSASAAAVRFQAMRARAAMPPAGGPPAAGAPGSVADLPSLLAWADRAGKGGECARLLAALGVRPPDEVAATGAGPTLALLELEWRLFAPEARAPAALLLRLAGPAAQGGIGLEALGARARAWVRRGAARRLASTIAAARALPGADADRLARLELLSGSASDELRAAWIARLAGSARSREDVLALAALAPTKQGEAARGALVRALGSGAALDDVAAGLDLALEGLRAARQDEAAQAFEKAVREAAAAAAKEVRARFRPELWPPASAPDPVRAQDRDRTLDRSGL